MKMLTVVDGSMRGRDERKNDRILPWTIEGEGGLQKTKLLTVVDGREGGWVKILKIVDGCWRGGEGGRVTLVLGVDVICEWSLTLLETYLKPVCENLSYNAFGSRGNLWNMPFAALHVTKWGRKLVSYYLRWKFFSCKIQGRAWGLSLHFYPC